MKIAKILAVKTEINIKFELLVQIIWIFFPVKAESSQISILYQWDANGMLYFACFDFFSKAFFLEKLKVFLSKLAFASHLASQGDRMDWIYPFRYPNDH